MTTATLDHYLDSHLLNIRRHHKTGEPIRPVNLGTLGNFTFKPTKSSYNPAMSRGRQLRQEMIRNQEHVEAYIREEHILLGWELGAIAPAELRLQILEANPIIFQRYTNNIENDDR